MKVSIEMGVLNESNQRSHWRDRAKRMKAARHFARLMVKSALVRHPVKPALMVTLTRVAPQLLDNDGLVSSLKAIRDGVADALHVDDRTRLVRWRYAQQKGDWGVEVEVRAVTAGEVKGPSLEVVEVSL